MTRWLRRARDRAAAALGEQRRRASRADALPQLAVLGLACGLVAALLMIAFRTAIDLGQAALLPAGPPEHFEALSASMRFLLPLCGALLVGLAFVAVPAAWRQVGVVHVMERLDYHQGVLPARNAVMQFVGAAASLAFGLPVGREGPAIHLGAASASVLGRTLGLGHDGLRVLVGCGVAAAIAASFNTPLAGVAFAMEVVLVEYTVVAFAPVILAAVCATGVMRAVYGNEPAFVVPHGTLQSLWELPYVMGVGLAAGVLAAAFIAIARTTAARTAHRPLLLRMLAAGLLAGACAVVVPQVMGLGYRTVSDALGGEGTVLLLLSIALFKLLSSATVIGLGVPAGLIGPMLVIGAAAGGALGMLGAAISPIEVSSPGYYALIGLGAMMAGTLHAPLAALTAMLELTGNPDVVLPGMLATIAAYGVSRVAFGQQPVFVALLKARGLDHRSDPAARALRSVEVGAAADRSVAVLPRAVEREVVARCLASRPNWIVVVDEAGRPATLLPAVDLALQLAEHPGESAFDLVEIPARRLELAQVGPHVSLQQGLDLLDGSGAQALCVALAPDTDGAPAWAVLTRAQIERGYRFEG